MTKIRRWLNRIWTWMVSVSESIAWARMKQVEAMMYRDCKSLEDIERLQKALSQNQKSI